MFACGFLCAYVLFAGFWTVKHWKALATAFTAPEVVEQLKIQKTLTVK